MTSLRGLAALLLATRLVAVAPATAVATNYTDEATYLAALATLGVEVVFEGFEDDLDWADTRISPGVPSNTAQGITWWPNTTFGDVRTGTGPPRTGLYGFFQIPHGDPLNGIFDGWIMTSDQTLNGVGGWIDGDGGAEVVFILDGVAVGDSLPVGGAYHFAGVIDTDGFTTCEVRETESVDEWRLLFADDFTFGRESAVGAPRAAASPSAVRLLPNAPNPFGPTTRIRFEIREAGPVGLRVVDAAGRLVRRVLDDAERGPGVHGVAWNGTDESGRRVAPGVYWTVLESGGARARGKMTLLR